MMQIKRLDSDFWGITGGVLYGFATFAVVTDHFP